MQLDRPICGFGLESEYSVAASRSPAASLTSAQYRALAAAVREYVPNVGSNSVLAAPKGTWAVPSSRWIIAHQDPCRVPCDWTGFAHGEGCERLQIASTPLCAPTSLASAVSQ